MPQKNDYGIYALISVIISAVLMGITAGIAFSTKSEVGTAPLIVFAIVAGFTSMSFLKSKRKAENGLSGKFEWLLALSIVFVCLEVVLMFLLILSNAIGRVQF